MVKFIYCLDELKEERTYKIEENQKLQVQMIRFNNKIDENILWLTLEDPFLIPFLIDTFRQ
jgi:hypothetical protein